MWERYFFFVCTNVQEMKKRYALYSHNFLHIYSIKKKGESKFFYIVSLISNTSGIALDGHLKDEDVNLASSTLIGDGKSPSDAMGIVISYSIRIKVNCGTLGGELVTDVPFKLMHPAPGNLIDLLFNFLKDC